MYNIQKLNLKDILGGLIPYVFIGVKMKPNFRKVLEMALEEGVRYGYNRAHKHVENPHEDAVVDNVVDGAMNSLYEWFDFEDNYESN